jgi:hypothetical protein
MEYKNIDELKKEFAKEEDFKFPDEMHVDGVRYRASNSSNYNLMDMIKGKVKAVMVYGTPFKEQAKERGLNQFIAFLWGFPQGRNAMLPYDVRTLTAQKLGMPITEAAGEKVNIDKEKVLGVSTEVFISTIPGCPPIKAKVDSGADFSSLHADEWNVDGGGTVTFMNPDISPNRITLPVIEKQAIKSSNGDVEYRPVVQLNVKVNGVPLTDVMFNLNDRGSMEYAMLVGRNILERGGFMIDPKITEDEEIDFDNLEIDWEMLAEEFKEEEIAHTNNKEITEEDVIEYIKNIKE